MFPPSPTLAPPMSPVSTSSSASLAPSIPFVRKRLQHEQTLTLLAVFEHRTHPSKEERALLAAQLGMEMKAVSAWFQNKRRGLKKKTLVWRSSATGGRSENAASHSSRLARTLARKGPGYSLDCIASARERRTAPHTTEGDPLRPPLASRPLNAQRRAPLSPLPLPLPSPSPAPVSKSDLWEHIPSSPSQPPSSPAADSMRLAALPPRSRTMRSLEWACAKARASTQGPVEDVDVGVDVDGDVPPLVLDTSARDGEADEDTELEDFEAITPDASAVEIQLSPLPARAGAPNGKMRMEGAPHSADMEAAMALLGFMGRSL